MNLTHIQQKLGELNLDGWLFFDHHQRDPLAYRILGLHPTQHVTRRWYYFIPSKGDPEKLVHRIESHVLETLPGKTVLYSSWIEQTTRIGELLGSPKRVAMQYSPLCRIPYISLVDAGTVELVRSFGIEVATSAELVQYFEAQLDQLGLESHLEAGRRVDGVRAAFFEWVARKVTSRTMVNEFQAAEFVRARFAEKGLMTNSGPIVAVNEHSADPHYEPDPNSSSEIKEGDCVLLDLWAKLEGDDAVYYDITWNGVCSRFAPPEVENIFSLVAGARDLAIDKVKSSTEGMKELRGFEVDDAARNLIQAAGYGDRFVHRTGHSIGREVHGNGANMDNLETHDDRRIIPWSCFSIEPGVYLERFGIRSEVNMFVDDRNARVTGEIQRELVLMP